MTTPSPLELNEDYHEHHQASSFSNPIFFHHAQDQGGGYYSSELKQYFPKDQEVRDR